jgi:mannosyl-3-phosphoglycerate phosphatase
MNPSISVVVFADVHPASRATSLPPADAQKTLVREGIAVVLSSSMTRAELETVQQEFAISQPFICESGAAILIPHGYFSFDVSRDRDLTGYHVIEFGRPHAEVASVLHHTSTRLGIPVIGYSDLSIEQVARECGQSLSQARLAKLREYDEPFRLVDPAPDAHDRLWRALRAARLACTHQDVYEHVGAAVDQNTSASVLLSLYRRAFGAVVTLSVSRALDRATWVDTIVELARLARERRRSPLPAAG